jgi:hypothetical protein
MDINDTNPKTNTNAKNMRKLVYSTQYFNICQDKNKHTTFTISTTNPNNSELFKYL